MTDNPAGAAPLRRVLEAARADATSADLASLASGSAEALDEAFRSFAKDHGADAVPVLTVLASERVDRNVRRAAKRALYRLAQRGVATKPLAAPQPVVRRQPERATRAWLSAIDGSGSRAAWILFEAGYGALELCSLILNDSAGIIEIAGGHISKKRLDVELAALRAEQKLPWVETDPIRAVGLVAEALGLHASVQTSPPAAFGRWQHFFGAATPATPLTPPADVDAAALERSAELLELPELAGWFLDPEAVQSDAVDLLQARESRLVLSDQIKAEREAAIIGGVIEREFSPEARHRWARRLLEMAIVFRQIERVEAAGLAEAAAAAFYDAARDVRHHPFAIGLARRALEIAGEIALGRLSAADVSRKPGPVTASGSPESPSQRA